MQTTERYLMDKVMTASPAELTAMLFDAAVGSLRAAARLQEAGDWKPALPKVQRAQNIILELRSTLSPAGGEISANLDRLYTWCFSLLVRGQAERNVKATQEAISVLEPLQTAWREACLVGLAQPA